jgi:hypothetical protein
MVAALLMLLSLVLAALYVLPFLWRLGNTGRGGRPKLVVTPFELADPGQRQGEDEAGDRAASAGAPDGAALALLVNQYLRHGEADAGRVRYFEFAEAPSADPTASLELLDVLSSPVPVLGRLLAPLQRLAPQDVVTLKGRLQPESDRGVGLTLALSDARGRMLDVQTLWENTFDGVSVFPLAGDDRSGLASRYNLLAAPAAVWTAYRVRHHRRMGGAPLAVGDWKSYALFEAGRAWLKRKDKERARRAWAVALERDSDNLGALLNLAYLNDDVHGLNHVKLASTAAAKERKAYRRLLHPYLTEADAYRCDAMWYRAAYNLAACRAHAYFSGLHRPADQGPPDTKELESLLREALTAAIELVVALETSLCDLATPQRSWPARWPMRLLRRARLLREEKEEQQLGTFLSATEPIALILLAGLYVQAERRVGSTPGKKEFDGLVPYPRQVPRDDERAVARETLLKDLADSARDHTELVTKTPPLNHPSSLSHRARYNLACYYSELGSLELHGGAEKEAREHFERAVEELAHGMQAGDKAEWAPKDPTLDGVRTHESTKVRFEELVGRYSGTVPTDRERASTNGETPSRAALALAAALARTVVTRVWLVGRPASGEGGK